MMMRRVVSYGGPSGVPASQRLKLKLSMTAGMHLLTGDVKEDQQHGFLAPVLEQQQERIIHRTSGVTRNFSSLESFKGFVNGRRDSITSVGSSTLEGKDAEQSESVVSGLLDRVETKHDKALVGSSAGRDLVVDGLGSRDAGGNPDVKNVNPGSCSSVGKDASPTTNSVDLTITPARLNAADRGKSPHVITDVSLSGASHSELTNELTNGDNSLKERVWEFDRMYAAEPSVCCSEERHEEEGCKTETSSISEVVDRQQTQGLECELRICELASVCTSSIDPGGVDGRRTLPRDSDGGHLYEKDQAKDSDESVAEEPSVPNGSSRPNGIQEDILFRNSKSEDNAALRVQSWWKGWLQRKKYRVLKEEVVATTRRSQELNNAALVLQKTWRAAQSRLKLKHLKIQKTVRNRAAAVIQAHIRGHWSRRELEKMSCAVLTIQECWRRYLALAAAASSFQQTKERRLRAAITLQAYARGYVVRRKQVRMHKAATTIQRQWKVYSYVRTQAATTLQAHARGFLSRQIYSTYKKTLTEERAAVLIQSSVRGHLVRCHLTILHTAALIIQLQWRRYSHKCQPQAAAAEGLAAHGANSVKGGPAYHQADSLLQSGDQYVGVENGERTECSDEIDIFQGEELLGCSSKDAMEFTPDASSEKVVEVAVDRSTGEFGKAGEKGYDLAISSGREDSGLRPLLNGELPATPTGVLPVGKASHNEDWDNVPVDRLHECLDTCLASLRSRPCDLSASAVAAEQCFPKFVILEEALSPQQPSSNDRPTGCFSVDGTEPIKVAIPTNAQATTISLPKPRLQKALSKKGVKHEIAGNVSSISSDNHLSQFTLSSRGSLQPAHSSSDKPDNKDPRSEIVNHQVEETDQGGGKLQGTSRHAESLKRNEERLQQFAQVFLLQRQIAYQQQRAQSAPPFPPPALLGAGSSPESRLDLSTGVCTKYAIPARDPDSVAVDKVHHSASASEVTSRHTKHNLHRGKECCSEASPTISQPVVSNQGGGASAYKQHRQTPRPDVVVDMVLLLRKIEDVYGKSDVDFVEASNSCFPTRSGDIEEGGPVQDRKRKPSTLGFTRSMSITQIGLPNVNAMLLVIIALVVYTKTICQGVIFGTKQTHRKI